MAGPADAFDDELLLNALADGELDAATALALERRLAADPGLAAAYDRICAVRERVAGASRPEVGRDFEARMAQLGGPVTARTQGTAGGVGVFAGWRRMAAAVVVTALLAGGLTHVLEVAPSGLSLDDAVAASHRRGLLATSPVDIASSDRHTVKPWLDAKLGISPPATDLASQGYPLVGGRVEVLGADTVPTLVYRHNEHLITLLAAPGAKGDRLPATGTAGGYNIVRWSAGGFSFWAVSDLEPAELNTFVSDYRGK